jgi:hypothetical protein
LKKGSNKACPPSVLRLDGEGGDLYSEQVS